MSGFGRHMEYLIPTEFFDGQSNLVLLGCLAVGVFLLVQGAHFFVEGAVSLARRLGIPKVIIGATVVSLGTTTPEAAVSVMAAFKGLPDFALGNAVGSIICDTALIFALAALITRLPLDRFVLNRHGWIQFGAGTMLVVVAFVFRNPDGVSVIPRAAGVVFLLLLAAYLWASVRWARQHGDYQGGGDLAELEHHAMRPLKASLWVLLGMICIAIASHLTIQCVRVLCTRWGVPPSILAATLIAFGTSLPELATALTSVWKGHPELVLGNVVGADILNVLFVTGAAATAVPLEVDPLFFRLHFPAMLAVLIVFRLVCLRPRNTFPRLPAILLLGLFMLYVAANLFAVR